MERHLSQSYSERLDFVSTQGASRYAIEKSVPLPRPPAPAPASAKYPFGEMEVGDSFDAGPKAEAHRVSSAVSYYGKRHGKKFTVRTQNGRCRCWRVA